MKKFMVLFFLIFFPVSALAAFNVTTLGELEQDVKNNQAIGADPSQPDSVVDDFINLACIDIASYGAIIKVDTIEITSSTHIYALNEDFLEAFAVFPCTMEASRGLDRIDFRDWGKIAGATQLTTVRYFAIQPTVSFDTGSVYLRKAANLWLYPRPTATDSLIVIYFAEATELSVDGDTTNVPYIYRDLIGFYATALSFSRAQEYDKSAWWLALYDQMRQRKGLKLYQPDYMVIPKQIGK